MMTQDIIRNRYFNGPSRRTGTTYLAVMAVAAIASLIAVSSLAISSVQVRKSLLEQDLVLSSKSAISSIEIALDQINSSPSWRDDFKTIQNSTFSNSISSGPCEIDFCFIDPVDLSLENAVHHPFDIIGRAESERGRRAIRLTAWPADQSLDILRCMVHSNQDIVCTADITTGGNGPISSNQMIDLRSGSVLANLESNSIRNSGVWIQGSNNSNLPLKEMPSRLVFDLYQRMATEIPFETLDSSVRDFELSPTQNPFGSVNDGGIYRISVPSGKSLNLSNCKIEATLLIDFEGNGSQFSLGDGVVWNSAFPQLPTMISRSPDGNSASLTLRSQGSYSSGVTEQPAHLKGLFHVICLSSTPADQVRLEAPSLFKGTLVSDATVQLSGDCQLEADPDLLSNPPAGYTTSFEISNLINNGNFIDGLKYWIPKTTISTNPGPYLAWDPTNSQVTVSGRKRITDGLSQDISAWVENGQSTPIGLIARTSRIDDEILVALEVHNTLGDTFRSFFAVISIRR